MSKQIRLQRCKLLLFSIFSFILGCMLSLSLVSIDKTCKIENSDREFNIMNDSKLKSPELIVLILSAPENFSKRNIIRETWLKLRSRGHLTDGDYVNFKHYFVIGGSDLNSGKAKTVNNEQLKYNDILILPVKDSYSNLTLKVLKSFEWLQGQYEFGVSFKYVLKCDDDSFVRIDSLIHEMVQIELIYVKTGREILTVINDNTSPYLRVNLQANDLQSTDEGLDLYWGYFNGNAKVKASGKWKESNWILCDTYLPYALGGGYVLSRKLITFIAQNSDYLRLFHSEDISVGVWLSGVKNLLRIHDARFDTEWTTRGCRNHHLIMHSVSQKQMYAFYQNVIKTGNVCAKEETSRRFYMYNWTAAPSGCCNRNV